METYVVLLAAIGAWSGICLFLRSSNRLGDPWVWGLLLAGLLFGYVQLFGSSPGAKAGDWLSMAAEFLFTQFGLLGIFAAIGGGALGWAIGRRSQVVES